MQHGRLYLLPKIHKIDLTLRNAIKTNKMLLDTLQIPGRPIVSLCNSPLERVGHFVDYFLKEIVCKLWTYTKDTTSFINKVEKIRVPNHAILSNFDISSMYSNLNHHEIIEAINRAWPKIESCKFEIPLPPKKDFLELVRIIVENNEFEFSNQIYRQKVGVPMGARPSPSLTDLRMFELISEILKKFTHSNKILHLSIYRDDGFIIFDGEEDEIKQLFEIANNIHPLIKFTHEISTKNIQFLDVTVYKGNRFYAENILDFKLYRKPTDNYQYLERSSAHPASVFNGFIIGEITRLIRSCTNKIDLDVQVELFKTKLLKRGYTEKEIEPIFNRTLKKTRVSTLQYKVKKKGHPPPLVLITKFNPIIKQLGKTLRKHWNIIEKDDTAKQIFKRPPMIAYKKHKNLKEYLTSAKLK